MTDAPDARAAMPRPTWDPVCLICRSCKREWDDWQPSGMPVETWLAHANTYRCPQCGVGTSRIVLGAKRSEIRGTALSEKPSVGPSGIAVAQARLVVTDDGDRILLTVYPAGGDQPLAVELSPERAVRLCTDLSAAAALHMGRKGKP